MNTWKRKLNKQGGFTLVEMLVVVAIIAILVAVSIPVVANALERTRHATDAANERAAKAEILIQYLSDEDDLTLGKKIEADTAYYYDAKNGVLKEAITDVTTSYGTGPTYGKHKTTGAVTVDHTHSVIAVSINAKGEVAMAWVSTELNTGGKGVPVTDGTGGLCSAVAKVDHTNA